MTITFASVFDTVILDQPATRSASPAKAARAADCHQSSIPVSLWRHTLTQDAAETRHSRVAGKIFGLIAALGLGSVSYAAWQTCALMSGHHLQAAVSAFLR